MFYRENGQFKTNYKEDQQIFPITQDRLGVLLLIAFAFIGVPMLADEYMLRAILIPFLILSLAALGVNILVGYCGQISLGSGAFMAVGAYAAYNFLARIEGMPLLVAILMGGVCATGVGVLFGIPSLRIKGLYLAVATLAAQFFVDWTFLRISWFTNNSSSGSVSVSNLHVFGLPIESPLQRYMLCLAFVAVFALLLRNWWTPRGRRSGVVTWGAPPLKARSRRARGIPPRNAHCAAQRVQKSNLCPSAGTLPPLSQKKLLC